MSNYAKIFIQADFSEKLIQSHGKRMNILELLDHNLHQLSHGLHLLSIANVEIVVNEYSWITIASIFLLSNNAIRKAVQEFRFE